MMRTGALIALLFCVLSFSATSAGETALSACPGMEAGTVRLDTLPSAGVMSGKIHIRVKAHKRDRRKASLLFDYRSPDDFYAVDFEVPDIAEVGEIYHARVSYVLRRHYAGSDSVLIKSSFAARYRPENPGVSVVIQLDHLGAVAMLGTCEAAATLSLPIDCATPGLLGLQAVSDLDVARYDVDIEPRRVLPASPFENLKTLKEHIAMSEDLQESFWAYLDRNLDPVRASVGRFYNLATVRIDDGSLLIVDADNVSAVKGLLRPTIFINHFDLLWVDAAGRIIDIETNADIVNGSVLTLNFPLHKSSIRFRKVSD